MRRVRVKVCGITRPEDAVCAARLGADAVGLIFCESPRRVDAGRARRIVEALPPFVTPVGVFMDAPADEVLWTVRNVGLGAVQLHGTEPPEDVREIARVAKVIKAVSVQGPESFEACAAYPEAAAFLFDTYVKGRAGGTGRTFDWTLLDERALARLGGKPWILAGGLRPENIATALGACRPFGVDVSSGVEREPGVKDAGKMAQFIAKVRRFTYEE